jgi:hypothetical protein
MSIATMVTEMAWLTVGTWAVALAALTWYGCRRTAARATRAAGILPYTSPVGDDDPLADAYRADAKVLREVARRFEVGTG